MKYTTKPCRPKHTLLKHDMYSEKHKHLEKEFHSAIPHLTFGSCILHGTNHSSYIFLPRYRHQFVCKSA